MKFLAIKIGYQVFNTVLQSIDIQHSLACGLKFTACIVLRRKAKGRNRMKYMLTPTFEALVPITPERKCVEIKPDRTVHAHAFLNNVQSAGDLLF